MPTQCSPPRSHLASRRSNSVRVELDLAEDIFCCAHGQQMRLLSLRIHFPFHLSRFLATRIHVSLFFVSLPFISSVSSGLSNSLISSSHLFFGLPTSLYVWCLMLKPGFHSAAFFAHRSSGSDAILIRRHIILLCVCQIQHGILPAFILSTAVAVLLFMYSIRFFLFNFSCVTQNISVFHEGDVTVLVAICV